MGIFSRHRLSKRYSDEELLHLMRLGGKDENRALSSLYDHLCPAIVRWVKQYGGREADGEDAFQTGLLAFHVALRQGRFGGEGKVCAFIWKASKMAWRMRCRKWIPTSLDDTEARIDPDTEKWMRKLIFDEVNRDAIRSMLCKACPKCARLLELQFFRGYLDEALADELGVKGSTLKVDRSRCLRKIREYITEHPEAAELFEASSISLHSLRPLK